MTIVEYVQKHTTRGECKCGQCIDAGTKPDPAAGVHTADMIFFKVAKRGDPDEDTFRKLTADFPGEYAPCDPFDGREHNYMELGGWIGDQGLSMQYMGLGFLLGVFELLTPRTMLPAVDLPEANQVAFDQIVMKMAGHGLVAIQAKREKQKAA